MPRLSPSGKTIFPASEIAEFTVCPEAWVLKRLTQKPTLDDPQVEEGEELHQKWAIDVEYEYTLGRLLRLLAALLMSATILMLIIKH